MSTERIYRSTLREERSQETKLRIRTAARELFSSGGFSDTTIAQIAERAGVAPQTVYSVFGSKGGIVTAMLEDLEESASLDSWVGKMMAEEDSGRQLRLFVSWIRTLFESGAPILRAALAARGDVDVAAFADQGDERRRDATRRLTSIWAENGALSKGVTAREAAQSLWLLTSVEQYLLAVDKLGWSSNQYERWLGDLLEREILKA